MFSFILLDNAFPHLKRKFAPVLINNENKNEKFLKLTRLTVDAEIFITDQ